MRTMLAWAGACPRLDAVSLEKLRLYFASGNTVQL